jgi:ubiquinone/menaquinone biosynthesis C-methylase UbiE
VPDEASHVWNDPETARNFLQNVRGAIPLAIEQIDMMLRLLAAARNQVGTFVDLGCGDGVLSAAILTEHAQARGILVDLSETMLGAARRQMQAHAGRVEFVRADFSHQSWIETVARYAPFDAVVSAFAIHHSSDQRKRELYAEIYELLLPGGIFINIEHVASATRWTESIWDDYMIDAIFGAHLSDAEGKSRADVARDYYQRADKNANILAPLEVQCDWLREIGYENVECYLKVLELAMFGGQRPGGTDD